MHCCPQAKTLRAQYSRGVWLRHPLYAPTTARGYRRVPCVVLVLHRCAAEPGKTDLACGPGKGCGVAVTGSPQAPEAAPGGRALALPGTLRCKRTRVGEHGA